MKKFSFDMFGFETAIIFLVAIMSIIFMGVLTYHLYGGGFCK